jgi:hypothetical protein
MGQADYDQPNYQTAALQEEPATAVSQPPILQHSQPAYNVDNQFLNVPQTEPVPTSEAQNEGVIHQNNAPTSDEETTIHIR